MPKETKPECHAIIKENRIPVDVEVCGLESIELKNTEELKYGFLVDEKSEVVVLGKDKITAMFKSTSGRCPITKY